MYKYKSLFLRVDIVLLSLSQFFSHHHLFSLKLTQSRNVKRKKNNKNKRIISWWHFHLPQQSYEQKSIKRKWERERKKRDENCTLMMVRNTFCREYVCVCGLRYDHHLLHIENELKATTWSAKGKQQHQQY